MTRISEHFTLSEFAVSRSHPELVEPVPVQYEANVDALVTGILEPIRRLIGVPMTILSGYRSPALNAAVGGSDTSQHLTASAADWTIANTMEGLFLALYSRPNKLPSGQMILYQDRQFIHSALPSKRYPTPSFHVHWPARGMSYQRAESRADLLEMLSK